MNRTITKRSVCIHGHRTSISLEDGFWQELQAISRRRGATLNEVVSEIDRERKVKNLSSAVRCFVLDSALHKVSSQPETAA